MTGAFSFDVLSDESLVMTVGEFCIQTTAEKAHREVTTALFKGRSTDTTLGALADMLEPFLSTTNFAVLRAEHPELAGGTECRVRLPRSGDDNVRWEVVEER